jgi:hypothetical protein
VVFSAIVIGSMTAINFWLYLAGLVLPLASVLVMGTTFALNMSYSYFVEKNGPSVNWLSVRYTLRAAGWSTDGQESGGLQHDCNDRELVMFATCAASPICQKPWSRPSCRFAECCFSAD